MKICVLKNKIINRPKAQKKEENMQEIKKEELKQSVKNWLCYLVCVKEYSAQKYWFFGSNIMCFERKTLSL
jgi:hypothetical protein